MNTYEMSTNMTRRALVNDAILRAKKILREGGTVEDAMAVIFEPKVLRAHAALEGKTQ